ncbi:hypothetical protein [Streptomyces sp. YS415]|uniref:hypothetical protein n=1 Tax=Streptomyces sp. YS415 TaxID=2944806 RepID=UPI0020207E12|nr:hypothetical protein [Streptomyces sp. YS415]MCL7427195.1 hypothetical protein [Streptomyces sp. YS415]
MDLFRPGKGGTVDNCAGTSMGVYTGHGAQAVAAVVRHEELLGRPMAVGTDYLPHGGWTDFDPATTCAWQLRPWRKWREERPGSSFVFGVPLLVDGWEGQFARGAAGAFDAAYARAASALVNAGHGDAIIRLGWEPNNRVIGPWQAADGPSGYAALLRRAVAVFHATPGAWFMFELLPSFARGASARCAPSGACTAAATHSQAVAQRVLRRENGRLLRLGRGGVPVVFRPRLGWRKPRRIPGRPCRVCATVSSAGQPRSNWCIRHGRAKFEQTRRDPVRQVSPTRVRWRHVPFERRAP